MPLSSFARAPASAVAERSVPDDVARLVARHAFGWLVAANGVGVWLAVVLLWPALGDAIAPLTYGRWVPLHLDWQLYGWCALPLVGALLAWCLEERHPHALAHARVVLGTWSLALAAGGLAWLGGQTSGKLFLDWHGWTRPLLPVAMLVLWTVLAAHATWSAGRMRAGERMVHVAVLAALVAVPPLFYWAAGREVYPAVNPDSGGATGAALLGSTLGVVAIFGLLPVMLRVPPAPGPRRSRFGRSGFFWGFFAASAVAYAIIDHGNASHHAPSQIVALGLLLAWVPALWIFGRGFAWSERARPWLRAAAAWWLLLVVTGWVTFLPGVSERLKFTNALVAHAHLAMAGLVTSVNGVILHTLARGRLRTSRGSFWLWQGGCALHVAVLLILGVLENDAAGALFLSAGWTQGLFGVRLAAGVTMGLASVQWLMETRHT
ncbi:MAG TPA: hypothetical protein VGD81_17905 [Opitutaceae bacterium]